MNKGIILGGLAVLGLVAVAKAKGSQASFSDAVLAMRARNAKRVAELSESKDFDEGTRKALFDQSQRMQVRLGGPGIQPLNPIPAPALVPLSNIDIDNNEFAAKIVLLEGDVGRLKAWEAAYRPVYPPIADAIAGKLTAINELSKPVPPPPVASPPAAPVVVNTPAGPVTVSVPPTPTNPPPVVTPVSVPTSLPSLPPSGLGEIPVIIQPTIDPLKKRTIDLITHLNSHPRPTEDKDQVRFWQQSVGQKPDGLYGVTNALVMAERFDLVPPLPYHFSKDPKKTAAAKAEYKRRILAKANAEPNPARVQLWINASKVDNR